MLRITTDMTEGVATIILEGRLAGVWIAELARCWDTVRAARPERSIAIDLRGLIFLDADGKRLLAEMHADGADFVVSGCWMKHVVEDISTGLGRRPMASKARRPQDERRTP